MSLGYLELKISWELFHKAPETLAEDERSRVASVAGKQQGIEQKILSTPEAASVVVPPATLAQRLAEIKQRYAGDEEFAQDLARLGLPHADFEAAVERDLKVEAVLEKIASLVPAVDSIEAEIYYRLHPEAFDRPESRRLRHILITFESATDKAKATAQLEALRSTGKNAENFASAALRHSQCPTAMEGGMLGVVKRGQLYTELEPVAFSLAEGEVSEVLESPIGLHILRCDEILPFGMLPFAEVRDRIIDRLDEKRRQEAQRDWIKGLFGKR